MKNVRFEAIVKLSCQDAFKLATDLPGYMDFLPVLTAVDILEQKQDGAKVRFAFALEDKLDALAKSLGIKPEQTAQLTWKNGRELVSKGIIGPFKSIEMRGLLTPVDANHTKVNVEVAFETGYIWPADNLTRHFIQKKGDKLIQEGLDAKISEALQRRNPKP